MLDMVTVTLIRPTPPRRYTPAPRRAIMPALNLDSEAIRRAGIAMQNSIDLARIAVGKSPIAANLAHIRQMQKGIGEAMMRHAEQVRAAFKKTGFDRIAEITRHMAAIMAEVSEAVKKGKELNRAEFDRLFPTVKRYLDKEGMILPTGADEFLTWFLYKKHRHRSFADILGNWPSITRADFREFHEYQLKEFWRDAEPAAVVGPLRSAPRPKFAAPMTAPRETPRAELPTLATARQVALFYTYLSEAGISDLEELAAQGTKTAAFDKLAAEYGYHAQTIKDKWSEVNRKGRLKLKGIKRDIVAVIAVLRTNAEHNTARAIAERDLRQYVDSQPKG